jgi:hypothetical protein
MAKSKVKLKEFTVYYVDGPVTYLVPETSDLFSEDVNIQDAAMAVREYQNYNSIETED